MKTFKKYKCIIVASLVMLVCQQAFPKIYWGGRAGISRSAMVQKMDLDSRAGWSIGGSIAGLADIPLYQRFSLRPEIAVAYQGGSFMSNLDTETSDYKNLNLFKGYSLQPSLNIAFNIPISGVKMTVYAGPALDLHFDDKLNVFQDNNDKINLGNRKIREFDIAINGGISVEYKGVFFSINALNGVLDRRVSKISEEEPVYQNNLTFSLGYIFR